MKLITKSLFTLLVCMLANTANAQVVYGNCQIQNVTLENLTCHGPAHLTNSIIKGKLSVFGPLEAQRSQLNTLEVKGPVHLDETTISGRAIVFGSIDAVRTKFLSDIYNESDNMQFTASSVNGVINMGSHQTQPVITAKERSSLIGNITFTQKEGLVKTLSESEVKGSINNGKKEEEKPAQKTDTKTDAKQETKTETKPEDKSKNNAKS